MFLLLVCSNAALDGTVLVFVVLVLSAAVFGIALLAVCSRAVVSGIVLVAV